MIFGLKYPWRSAVSSARRFRECAFAHYLMSRVCWSIWSGEWVESISGYPRCVWERSKRTSVVQGEPKTTPSSPTSVSTSIVPSITCLHEFGLLLLQWLVLVTRMSRQPILRFPPHFPLLANLCVLSASGVDSSACQRLTLYLLHVVCPSFGRVVFAMLLCLLYLTLEAQMHQAVGSALWFCFLASVTGFRPGI